jgi:hypothetical protein
MSRDVNLLLGRAKRRAGWKVTRTAAGCWRATHPSGGGITIATKLTPRAWLYVEAQMRALERTPIGEEDTYRV